LQPNAPHTTFYILPQEQFARRRFFPLSEYSSYAAIAPLLLPGVGGILEGAGGLLEDGVLPGVPLGEHPLLLKPGELPPVVDRREHLPHQDQRQPCRGKVIRNSETQSGTVRHGRTQSGTVRHGQEQSCTAMQCHVRSGTVRHS
jgi:hypothetical protein